MDENLEWEAIDKYFSDLVKEQLLVNGQKNHDVYEKRLTGDKIKWSKFQDTPFSMYFYYVRINRNGRLVIDHYYYFNGKDEYKPEEWEEITYDENGLTKLVRCLAINARPRVKPADKKPKRLRKGDFKKTKWNRKSYIAIFFDEANWKLRKKKLPGKPPSDESAVTFIVREGKKRGKPNCSFFDAIDLTIMMPIGNGPKEDERSAIVFVNHMKADEDGNDLLTKRDDKFEFKMIVDVQAERPHEDPPIVVIIDPGGTNGGPTVPPPPTIPSP